MNKNLRTAALLVLVPAAAHSAHSTAAAQATGISHPEAVPDQPYTTQDAPQPQPDSQPRPASTPALQPRIQPSTNYPPVPYSPTAVTVIATPVAGPGSRASFDPDANIVTGVEGPTNQLPAGTFLKTRIGQSVSTDTTREGTTFTAALTEPVLREGRVLIPAGSFVTGRVTGLRGGKRISGPAAIHLQPQTVTLPDGTRYKLVAQVIDTDLDNSSKVDDEGTIRPHNSSAVQKGAFALATGSGAVAGAVIAGPVGALVGAGIGAGASTVVWLREDQHATLPADTRIVFSLLEPLSFGASEAALDTHRPDTNLR